MNPSEASPRKLPKSYASFVSRTGAGTFFGWDVLAPEDVYEVNLDDGAFWVLAQREGDTYLLGHPDDLTLLVCEVGEQPRAVSRDFNQFLQQGTET